MGGWVDGGEQRRVGSSPSLGGRTGPGAGGKLPDSGLVTRGGSSTTWTGTELLLWGGAAYTGYTSHPYADGARYQLGAGR